MAEKSSFMERKKSSFKLFGKIEFPSKRTKKDAVVYQRWSMRGLYVDVEIILPYPDSTVHADGDFERDVFSQCVQEDTLL